MVRDNEGKPYSVRYDPVNAMLLNEFLKEHKAFVQEQRKVREQGATIARLEQQIEALIAGLQPLPSQSPDKTGVMGRSVPNQSAFTKRNRFAVSHLRGRWNARRSSANCF